MRGSSPVLLDVRGAVAHITLQRPEVLNAIDVQLAVALGEAIDEAVACSVRSIVLQGAGRVFCAGGDISSFDGGDAFSSVADRTMSAFHPVISRLASLSIPTVAAVHGTVAGAGIGLMLSCDFVLAATGTHFTLAYPKIGATIDAGASWFLVRSLGVRRAKEMAILADSFDVATALQLGLVSRIVAAEALCEESENFASALANGPTSAYAVIKRLVDAAPINDFGTQLDAERAAFIDIADSSDFAEGLAAFREKRPPKFSGQ